MRSFRSGANVSCSAMHVDQDGEGRLRLAREHDVEGIAAKRKTDPYLPEHATRLKIRNTTTANGLGARELFERERGSDPDFQVWHGSALACNDLDEALL